MSRELDVRALWSMRLDDISIVDWIGIGWGRLGGLAIALVTVGCMAELEQDRNDHEVTLRDELEQQFRPDATFELEARGDWLSHSARLKLTRATVDLRLIGVSELAAATFSERPELPSTIRIRWSDVRDLQGSNSEGELFEVGNDEAAAHLASETTEFQCGSRKLFGLVPVATVDGRPVDVQLGLFISRTPTADSGEPGELSQALAQTGDTCHNEGWIFVSCVGGCHQSPNYGHVRVCSIVGLWPNRSCACRKGAAYGSPSGPPGETFEGP